MTPLPGESPTISQPWGRECLNIGNVFHRIGHLFIQDFDLIGFVLVLFTDVQLFGDISKEINDLVSQARIVPKLLSAWTQNLTFSVFNNFLCPVSLVVLTASKCSSPSSESTQARSNLRCPLPNRHPLLYLTSFLAQKLPPHPPFLLI